MVTNTGVLGHTKTYGVSDREWLSQKHLAFKITKLYLVTNVYVERRTTMALVRFSPPSRAGRYDFPTVSIGKKMDRLNFNTATYDLLKKIANTEDVIYITIYLDDENPDIFYITPAIASEPDVRRLGKSSKTGKGRFLEATALMKTLGWEITETTTLRVIPNKEETMLLIDKNEIA